MTRRMKRKIKLYSSVAFAVFMLIACIITCVDGGWVTYAWFANTHVGQVDVATLIADSKDTVSGIKIYPYQKITDTTDPSYGKTDTIYTYSQTSVTSEEFGKYSLLEPDGNSLLIEIDLTEYAANAATLDLYATSSATSFLGELNSDGTLKQQLAKSGNSMSSIVCFYGFTSDKVVATTVSATSYYKVALADTANSTGAKMNFITSNSLNKLVKMAAVSGQQSKLYLVLAYDVPLIESIYSANIGNDVINDVTDISEDGQTYISYAVDFAFTVNASADRYGA